MQRERDQHAQQYPARQQHQRKMRYGPAAQQQPDDRGGRERERIAVQRKDGKGRERKAYAEQHAQPLKRRCHTENPPFGLCDPEFPVFYYRTLPCIAPVSYKTNFSWETAAAFFELQQNCNIAPACVTIVTLIPLLL